MVTRSPTRPRENWAVRDYKRHLKAVQRWKPASVNLALAALDSFYRIALLEALRDRGSYRELNTTPAVVA
jgi:hypothetical protein